MSSALIYIAIVVMWLGVLIPMWLHRDKNQLAEAEDSFVAAAADDDTGVLPIPVPDADSTQEYVPGSVPDYASETASDYVSGEAPDYAPAHVSGGADHTPGQVPEYAADQVTGSAPEHAADPGDLDTPESEAVRTPAADPRRAAYRRRAVIVARRRRRLFWCTLLVLASVVTATAGVIPWWGVVPSGLLMAGYLTVLRVAVGVDRERARRVAEARAESARRARERRRALEAAAQQHEAEIIELAAHQQDELFDQYAEMSRRAVGD
ncbi:divisome protein SepX/GlpR [Streptosporangium soli]|nr:hypothetical protein [Streptosporangium sp. KLBMP 9127]